MSVFPPPRPTNPPERRRLAYRRATYAELQQWIELLISSPAIPGIPAEPDDMGILKVPPNPLLPLPFDHPGFLQALFDAWSVVGDVLTFYQERIANEGFLGTAVHSYSVHELMRTIDHVPLPALSASTTFAFVVKATATTPVVIAIPKGTAIGAAPAGSAPPPTFETSAALEARVDWNAIAAIVQQSRSDSMLPASDTQAALAGPGVPALKPGSPITIAGNLDDDTSTPVMSSTTVRSVDVDRNAKVATVTWDPVVPALPADSPPIKAPQFTAFRGTAGLFGWSAPQWSSLTDAKKATYATRAGGVAELGAGTTPDTWSALAGGSDGQNVLAVAYDASGGLYALTAQHLQYWDATAQVWRLLLADPRAGLLSLAVAVNTVYVGTNRGDVRVSRDGGATWSDVGPPLPTMPPAADSAPPAQLTRLPAGAVRALAVWNPASGPPVVLAGTDRGLAAAVDDGSAWNFCNNNLGNVGSDGFPAPVAILSLAVDPRAQGANPATAFVLAATSSGGTNGSSLGAAVLTVNAAATASSGTPQAQPAPITSFWTMQTVATQTPPPSFSSVAWGTSFVFATGSGGLWRSPPPQPPPPTQPIVLPAFTWTSCEIEDDPRPAVVAIDAAGTYVVVSSPSGVRSSTSPVTGPWLDAELPPSWTTGPAAALAVGRLGTATVTAAALPLGAFPAEWPDFEVSGNTIDLERMVPTLAAGGTLLLLDDSGPTLTAVGDITQVQTVRASAFAQTALVTRLTVTWSQIVGGPRSLGFPRRTTRAYFDSRMLRLAPPPAAPAPAAPASAATPSRPQPAAVPSRKLTTVQSAQRAQLKRAAPTAAQPTPIRSTSFEIDGAPALLPPGRVVVVSGKPIRARIIGAAGGVAGVPAGLSPDDVSRRSFAPKGPGYFDCVALVPMPNPLPGGGAAEFLVATSQGVWRLAGAAWTYFGFGDIQPDAQGGPAIRALALAEDVVVAATAQGIELAPLDSTIHRLTKPTTKTTTQRVGPEQSTTMRGVAYDDDGATLWAGGDDGLWRSFDKGVSWSAVAEPGTPAQIRMLRFVPASAAREAMLVAGTSQGLALRTSGGWKRWSAGLTNTEVLCVAAVGERWFCGTRGGGLFRCDGAEGASHTWEYVPLERVDGLEDVHALVADENTGALYGSLRGAGVFRVDTKGAQLRATFYPVGIANDVRDLALAGETLFAASRSGTVLAPQPHAISMRALCTIMDTSYVASLDEGEVDPALRLELASNGVVLPATVLVQPITPHELWLIVVDGVDDLLLHLAPQPYAAQAILVSQIVSYPVLAAPDPHVPAGIGLPKPQAQSWTFALAGGAQGAFAALPGQVKIAPAVAADGDVAERAVVSRTVARTEKGTSLLTLSESLHGVYDATTVTVLGNAVDGTHGQTGATYEVVGSGDASASGQSFKLARKNVTMLPTGPGGEQQPQITVKVRPTRPRSAIGSAGSLRQSDTTADGAVTWAYVDELGSAPPAAHVYTVEQTVSGTATVMFGDGTHGRRLPTGNENVIAQYRAGSGPAGNLPPGTISRMPSAPTGVAGATNPVSAQGGTAAADPAATRRHSRDGLTSVQRVISFADVADYALAYGGFAKAHLRHPRSPKQKAYLTLAGMAGAAPDPALMQELLRSIRLDGGAALPIVAIPYRPRPLLVGATLTVPGDLDPKPVAKAAVDTLLAHFAFERRSLSEPVYAAEIIALLQAIAAVVAVELTALCELAWTPQVVDVLAGHDAWSATAGELLYQLAQADVGITMAQLP